MLIQYGGIDQNHAIKKIQCFLNYVSFVLLEWFLEQNHVRIRTDVLQLLLYHFSLRLSHKNIHFVNVFSSFEAYERLIIVLPNLLLNEY